MINRVTEVELHDEIVDWLATLSDAEWERVVVIVDRLAELGAGGADAAVTQFG